MSEKIIDRGRGPEIAGTRITVYRVMDFLDEPCPAEAIASELQLNPEQVQLALEYIAQHQSELTPEYERILQRTCAGNPPEAEWGLLPVRQMS